MNYVWNRRLYRKPTGSADPAEWLVYMDRFIELLLR